MERQLLVWLAGRFARRPLLWVVWIATAGLPWGIPQILGSIDSLQATDIQRLTVDTTRVWMIVGGLLGLSALAEIRPWIDRLPAPRRWRARIAILGMTVCMPALPLLLPLGVGVGSGTWSLLGAIGLAGGSSVASALVAERIPARSARSLVFLGMAWWLPALVPDLSPDPAFALTLSDASGHLARAPTSAAWLAAFGSILATTLIAIGLDLVGRPAP